MNEIFEQIDENCNALLTLCKELHEEFSLDPFEIMESYTTTDDMFMFINDMKSDIDKLYAKVYSVVYGLDRYNKNNKLDEILTKVNLCTTKVVEVNNDYSFFILTIKHRLFKL